MDEQLALAARLEQVAELLPDDKPVPWSSHRQCAEEFARGLRKAHALGEVVDFH